MKSNASFHKGGLNGKRLTKEDRARLEEDLKKAEPYTEEEADALELDGPYDFDRMNATLAKKFLEDDDRLKELGVEIQDK
ncbi:MAG: hypothetical protein PUC59_02020 [Firmicutes bacterium]|nr:hypothetical protein [Bacillota bacterium]